MLVAAGLGWSVLPDNLIDAQLTPLALPNAHIERNIGCLIHKKRTTSNAAMAFIELLQNRQA